MFELIDTSAPPRVLPIWLASMVPARRWCLATGCGTPLDMEVSLTLMLIGVVLDSSMVAGRVPHAHAVVFIPGRGFCCTLRIVLGKLVLTILSEF